MNDREMSACFDAVNAAAPSAQVAADVSLEFVGRDVFDLHDRFQQNGFALFNTTCNGKDRAKCERDFGGVALVEGAVNNIDLHIDDRITAQHAVEHRFL